MKNRTVYDWTVLERADNKPPSKSAHWLCVCVCGRKAVVGGGQLRGGRSKKCVACRARDREKRLFEALYNRFKRQAHYRKYEVNLTYEEFLVFTQVVKCHYCARPVVWTKHVSNARGTNYNLDRKDSGEGYSKENCVVCCTRCNRGKSNLFTYEEWFAMTAVFRDGTFPPTIVLPVSPFPSILMP